MRVLRKAIIMFSPPLRRLTYHTEEYFYRVFLCSKWNAQVGGHNIRYYGQFVHVRTWPVNSFLRGGAGCESPEEWAPQLLGL